MKGKQNTKLKVDDTVIVICGKDKGKKGKILKFSKDNKRVTVEGVNMVKKTMKKSQENQTGGIISQEAALSISNVMYLNGDKRCRIGMKVVKEGNQPSKKERFFKVKK